MLVNLFSDGPSKICCLTNKFACIIALNTHNMPIYFSSSTCCTVTIKTKMLKKTPSMR